MANFLTNIIKVTPEQYEDLLTDGYIIVNGVRYDYDANALYLVDDSDIQIPIVDLTSL